MIADNDLKVAIKAIYYISHQHELLSHCLPVRILNVCGVRHLFRKEGLRGLIKHYKSWNGPLILR